MSLLKNCIKDSSIIYLKYTQIIYQQEQRFQYHIIESWRKQDKDNYSSRMNIFYALPNDIHDTIIFPNDPNLPTIDNDTLLFVF